MCNKVFSRTAKQFDHNLWNLYLTMALKHNSDTVDAVSNLPSEQIQDEELSIQTTIPSISTNEEWMSENVNLKTKGEAENADELLTMCGDAGVYQIMVNPVVKYYKLEKMHILFLI